VGIPVLRFIGRERGYWAYRDAMIRIRNVGPLTSHTRTRSALGPFSHYYCHAYHLDNLPRSITPDTALVVCPCRRRLWLRRAFGCSRGTRRLFLGRHRWFVAVSLDFLLSAVVWRYGERVSRGTYLIVGRSTRFCVFSRKPAGVIY
jgi:hypothetical protein